MRVRVPPSVRSQLADGIVGEELTGCKPRANNRLLGGEKGFPWEGVDVGKSL